MISHKPKGNGEMHILKKRNSCFNVFVQRERENRISGLVKAVAKRHAAHHVAYVKPLFNRQLFLICPCRNTHTVYNSIPFSRHVCVPFTHWSTCFSSPLTNLILILFLKSKLLPTNRLQESRRQL